MYAVNHVKTFCTIDVCKAVALTNVHDVISLFEDFVESKIFPNVLYSIYP